MRSPIEIGQSVTKVDPFQTEEAATRIRQLVKVIRENSELVEEYEKLSAEVILISSTIPLQRSGPVQLGFFVAVGMDRALVGTFPEQGLREDVARD